ncbi:MAG: FecR domain-containing protein, partial [Planctomycetota bacterium]
MHRSPTHHDLIDHALGRLDPPRREWVERALREDPALARRARSVADHLALYDALPPSPPPPPFSKIASALPSREKAGRRSARLLPTQDWAVAAGGALAILIIVVFVWGVRSTPEDPVGTTGDGVRIVRDGSVTSDARVRPGDVLEADLPAEVWIGERVRVVMDGEARMEIEGTDRVRLAEGRAYFEVAPGPFRVGTSAGEVKVLGTRFELALSETGLRVAVEEGRVALGDFTVASDQTLVAGVLSALEGELGGWFRRPV